MAVATKDPSKLRAVAIMLAGAGFGGGYTTIASLTGNQSLHINLGSRSFSPGTGLKKESYAPRPYEHGWFNLDDPQGALAFLGAGMATVFNPPKVTPTRWIVGRREAVADKANKRIVIGCNVVSLAQITEMVAALEGKAGSGMAPKGGASYDFGFQTKNNDSLFAGLMMLQGLGYRWSDGTWFFTDGVPGTATKIISSAGGNKVIHVDAVRKLAWSSGYRSSGGEYPSGFFDLDTQGVQPLSKLLSVGQAKSWSIKDDAGSYSRTATADYGRKVITVVDDHSTTQSVPLATLKEMAAAIS